MARQVDGHVFIKHLTAGKQPLAVRLGHFGHPFLHSCQLHTVSNLSATFGVSHVVDLIGLVGHDHTLQLPVQIQRNKFPGRRQNHFFTTMNISNASISGSMANSVALALIDFGLFGQQRGEFAPSLEQNIALLRG